jgi:hypothetical protein
MSKTVRRVWLASQILLLCAAGSCHIGDRQYWYENQQLEKWMEASGLYFSHIYPDTNIWQIIGVLLFFVSVSVAIAAYMLGRQERKENQ